MVIRKLIKHKTIGGVTFPKEYTNALKLNFGDLVEVYLRDSKTIVVKPHRVEPKGITVDDK